MSHLKIFQPEELETDAAILSDRTILPFDRRLALNHPTPERARAVRRARLLHENQQCEFCGRATIEPIELDDAIVSRRNHRPVPGTATIVGFHCHSCSREWPIYERELA